MLTNEEVMLSDKEKFSITETKMKELQTWKDNNVYTEVLVGGQKPIPVGFVIME